MPPDFNFYRLRFCQSPVSYFCRHNVQEQSSKLKLELSMTKTHFYTASTDERQRMINEGFSDEGVCCYIVKSAPAGPAPFFRALDPLTGAHYYTTSIGNYDIRTSSAGFRYTAEGIACYLYLTSMPGTVQIYAAEKGSGKDFLYSTSTAEIEASAKLGYTPYLDGNIGFLFSAQGAGSVAFYRLVKGTHFYTANPAERQTVLQNGFTQEGITGYVLTAPTPNTPGPLYCSASTTTGSHLYTMSISERDTAVNTLGYVGTGITGYCYAAPVQGQNLVKLYRAYAKATDDHFYTTNKTEHDQAIQTLGYTDEGVTGYVMLTTASPAPPAGWTKLYRLYGEITNPPIQ
jgi:hypothetical protein